MSPRDRYLKSVWLPYPAIQGSFMTVSQCCSFNPSTSTLGMSLRLAGKVLEISPEERSMVVYQGDQQLKIVVLGPAVWGPSPEVGDPFLVLSPGDVLAIECGAVEERVGKTVWFLSGVQFTLLAPCHRHICETSEKWVSLRRWEKLIRGVRSYFLENGFWEADTPYLVTCPGMEPTLDPFPVTLHYKGGERGVYLPTSPELSLKRLLALGATHLFEIKKCFRDGEFSHCHQPEFWMLEWYRAYSSLDSIKLDLMGLLSFLAEEALIPTPISQPREVTMAELFQEVLSFELRVTTTKADLLQLCRRLGIYTGSVETWNDLFHLVFIEKIEPHLKQMGLVFLERFPPSQAALARITKDGWADRLEFYWNGLEIANAFHELNDPAEQQHRNNSDNRERVLMGKNPLPIDQNFMAALESGMPPSGGIALGLERLFMAAWGVRDLGDLKIFTFDT